MKLRADRLRWRRQEEPRMRALMLPIALALLNGCAAHVFYLYDTELPPLIVGGKPDYETRVVPKEKAPIPPVKFGQWFMPSSWPSGSRSDGQTCRTSLKSRDRSIARPSGWIGTEFFMPAHRYAIATADQPRAARDWFGRTTTSWSA